MKALADMGMKQGVLAPHERPHVPMLRRLGFTGDDISVVAQAMRYSPELLSSLSSASQCGLQMLRQFHLRLIAKMSACILQRLT